MINKNYFFFNLKNLLNLKIPVRFRYFSYYKKLICQILCFILLHFNRLFSYQKIFQLLFVHLNKYTIKNRVHKYSQIIFIFFFKYLTFLYSGNAIQIFTDSNLFFSPSLRFFISLSLFLGIFRHSYIYNFNPNICLPESVVKKSLKIQT